MSLLLLLSASGPPPAPGTIALPSIASAESVPGPTISATVAVALPSIASAESVPGPTVAGIYTLPLPSIASAESVGKPNVFNRLVIALPSIASAPAVGAPVLTLPSAPTPDSRILVHLHSRAGAFKATLSGSYDRSWQDVGNDVGGGHLVLQDDDADLALVDYFDVVRFELDGLVRFGALVESLERASLVPGEEADEATAVSGRGVVAVLESGVVYPGAGPDRLPIAESLVFNFASPELDDSTWSPAVAATQLQMDFSPAGWPDPDAVYLWDRYSAVDGTPPGDVYLRHTFTVADEGPVEIWIDVDDEYELWLDGAPFLSDKFDPQALGTPEHARTTLTAGDHLLAVRATNLNDLKAGVIITVLNLDANGIPTTVATSTAMGTWRALGYPPAPPGFTPGAVLRILVGEAQVRGALAGVTLGFSDVADTSGQAWPVTADIAFAVGTDLLSALRQLAETYLDFTMTVTLVLQAWGTRGTVTAVELEAGVNLTELHHAGKV